MAIVLIDGNGGTDQASVKPGSTAAVAADKPLVITAHPSSAALPVSISGTTPVSAASLPLPTGAATSAKQPALGTAGSAATDVLSVQGVSGMTALKVDGSAVTQPVSGSVTATVSGTVTANVGTTNGLALDTTLTGGSQKSKLVDSAGTNVATISASGALKVDGSAVTQPVSGTFFQATQPVSATSLPLPTGASTAAKQPALGSAGTASTDVLTVQGIASMTALKVDGSAVTQPISAASLPLPSGAATETSLTSRLADATFTGRINTQGQKTMSASTPVVLASDQASIPVTGTFFQATQPVSATALPLPTGAATSANQTTVGSQTTKLNDGTNSATIKAASTAAVAADTAIVVAISPNNSLTVANPSVGSTGAAPPTSAGLSGGSVTTAAPTYTTGQMSALSLTTAGALRVDASATTQPVSGSVSVSNFPGTQAISAASLPLPTGAATAAKQPALGTAGAASADVITVQGVASMTALKVDGSAVTQPVSGSVTATVSGTVTANVGTTNGIALDASVTALQVTQGSTTSGQKGALDFGAVTTAAPTYTTGQTSPLSLTTAGALRVDASTTTQPISAASLPLPTGAATAANLTTLGSQTSKINDGTNTAAVKAASTAVVAADPALVVAISPNNTVPVSVADVTATGALGALNAAVQINTSGLNSVGFQLAAGTLIGTLVAEISFDGGTTWNQTYFDPMPGSTKSLTIVFASANTATAATLINSGGSGLSRVRVSAYTSGTANITLRASQNTDPSVLFASPPSAAAPPAAAQIAGIDAAGTLRVVSVDALGRLMVGIGPNSITQTYSASATGVVPVATATDIFTITGSATKTVRINRIALSGTQGTAGVVPIQLVKRSTANTAGTSAAATAVAHDSANAAATATVLSYTANPTTGTLVGTVRSDRIFIPATATAVQSGEVGWEFGTRPGQEIVLRGTAQVLAINLVNTTLTTGSLSFIVEWTEE